MKKIFFSVALAATMLTACSDAYEIEQPGIVTEEAAVFRTPADIGKGIRTIYGLFPRETEISFTSFFTDELGIGKNNSGQGVNDGSYTFLLQAGTGAPQAIWGGYYGSVNRLNRIEHRILEMLETASNADKRLLNRHLAHVYGLRAFCHYKLFSFFTPDYTNPDGLSVIKFHFLQTDDYNNFVERSTVKEIVEFIESDIQKVRNLGGIDNQVGGIDDQLPGSGYASMPFIESIVIKLNAMLQTDQSYAKLEDAFNRLMNPPAIDPNDPNAISIPPKYLDGAELETLFTATPFDGGEAIFKLNRTSTDGSTTSGIGLSWHSARFGEGAYMEIGRSLYNELDKLDPSQQGAVYDSIRKDGRYGLTVHANSKVAPNYASMGAEEYRDKDLLFIGKYPGDIPNRPLMANLWEFRFTDMLLALAEKRAHEGNLTGNVAVDDYSNVESIIFNIRASRNFEDPYGGIPVTMPTDFSSKQAAFARILEERRVEFAFEGHRYLDMKRLGTRAGSPGFVRDPQDCLSTGACSLDPTSHRLTLPIPRSEMIANPRMVQNPGY